MRDPFCSHFSLLTLECLMCFLSAYKHAAFPSHINHVSPISLSEKALQSPRTSHDERVTKSHHYDMSEHNTMSVLQSPIITSRGRPVA